MKCHDAKGLQNALQEALVRDWNSGLIAQSVAGFGWDTNTRQVLELLDSVVGKQET